MGPSGCVRERKPRPELAVPLQPGEKPVPPSHPPLHRGTQRQQNPPAAHRHPRQDGPPLGPEYGHWHHRIEKLLVRRHALPGEVDQAARGTLPQVF